MATPSTPGMGDPWVILPQERIRFQAQFESLKPINGVVTGEQAKGFLLQSQLPPAILGQIWNLSDTDSDGKMNINEFSIACKLITLKLRGFEIPPALPPSLVASLQAFSAVHPVTPPQPLIGMAPLATSTPRPVVVPGSVPLGQIRPPVPPMPAVVASRQNRQSAVVSTQATSHVTSKPPARPAPPSIGGAPAAPVPQRPTPPGNIGPTFVSSTAGPPPKPVAPPSFPNSPVLQTTTPVKLPPAPGSTIPHIQPAVQQSSSMAGIPSAAPIAPMNVTPAPVAAFGMAPTMPIMPQMPIGVVTTISPLSTMTGNGAIPATGVLPMIPPVAAPIAPVGGVPVLPANGSTIHTPVSTNTPLSTTARPPSIDRIGSVDSPHSQHSQHSVGSPPPVEWAVPHQTKLKYTQVFNTCDKARSGYLLGPQARNIMVQSQLPQAILAKIWTLSDMDSNGRLSCEEFVLAMHLCEIAKAGEAIPNALPPELIPPTFRRQRQSSLTPSLGTPDIDPLAGMPQTSFEDKRRENFEKGQAELDRRRKSLLEVQRKEQEERERKEREEAEKQEKIRLEQEKRRQAEIEKQMIRQQEIEQEKEEQRKRAAEQRESARKEMERQRQLEWEKQKSQELQAQRQKEQDFVLKLKAKNQTLTIELGSLNDKVKELSQKICDTRVGVSSVKNTIDGMRTTRDTQLQEMAALKNKLREQNQRLLALSQEKARIEAKNKMNAAQDNAGQEAMKMAFVNKQITLKQLKDKIADLQEQINSKMTDIENNNSQLEEVKTQMKDLADDCKKLYGTFETKKKKIIELRGGGHGYAASAWGESAWGDSETAEAEDWPVDEPAPAEEETAPGVMKYRALYEFVARNGDEISFQPGDIILVPPVQNAEPGWMAGEIRGHTGWFPESYVEPIDVGIPSAAATFVQQDSIEKRTLEGIAEVPENVSEAGSLVEAPAEPVEEKAVAETNGAEVAPGLNEYYMALYQYASNESGDLNFNGGDVILVIKKDGDWWTGVIGDRTGIFPSNYVEKYDAPQTDTTSNIPAAQPEEQKPAKRESLSEAVEPVQEKSPLEEKTAEQLEDERAAAEDRAELPDFTAMAQQQKSRKPEIVQVIASYQATSTEQLSLQKGQLIMIRKKTDSGWWEGELQARGKKRQIGWFPASYVKLLTSSSNRSTPISHGYQDSPTDPNVERVMALYPYQAQNEDELNFEKGDVITVVSKDEEAWWKGELNGATGVFPSNYVSPMYQEVLADILMTHLNDTERKRQGYIKELISTEQAYIDDMKLVHEVFEKPLLNSLVLKVDEVDKIFINWRDIISCNENFLRTLRIRRDNSDGGVVRMIGDILCENIPRMSAYIRFCSCQISAASYFQKLFETCPGFTELVKKCQQNPRTKGMPLSSFLIKPMQRITKYPLIIKKISEHTPDDHPDKQYLQEAFAKAEEFCRQVNEGVREQENSDRLEWLQNHINCEGLEDELVFNSLTNSLGPRKLLHFGILHKAKSGKELVCFLTNDFMLFAQPYKSLTDKQFSFDRNENQKFKMYRKPIFLSELSLASENEANSESNSGNENSEQSSKVLKLKDLKKIIILVASTTNECSLWKKRITEARNMFVENEKNLFQRQRSKQAQFGACGRILVTVLEGANLKTVSVRRRPPKGYLRLEVRTAEDLKVSKKGKCNAFCKVSMGSQESQTVVVSGTDPIWDSSMQFQVKDLHEDTLCITVFDKGHYSPDEFLGRAEVRVADIMKDSTGLYGPIQKRFTLKEVDTGSVILKLDLHLFNNR